KVVPDQLVSTAPPKASEVKSSVVASSTEEGELLAGNITVDVGTGDGAGGIGVGTGSAAGNGSEILDAVGVEVFPEFPGGMDAWTKFIQKNLRYPPMAQQ